MDGPYDGSKIVDDLSNGDTSELIKNEKDFVNENGSINCSKETLKYYQNLLKEN